MDTKTIDQILYYVNQGGPGLVGLGLYAVYQAYQMLTALMLELKQTNMLLTEQNELLGKEINSRQLPKV